MSWFGSKKKQKKKQYSGFPGDCSQQQLQTLQKFRKHVHENKNISINKFDDIYLLRFLRARKFDLQKTIKMWDDYINWRVKHEINNCIKFKFPQLPQLRKIYPHGYHKVDKQFRPIYIERVGFMDVQKVFKVMNTQNMLRYYALLYETLLTTIFDGCTKAKLSVTEQNGKVSQTITILDLKHVKLGNVSKAYDFLKPVTAMAQDNYPQILGNMFIVNAPMLFTGIWTIVKMWIDDKTKEKIKILGSSYKKQLLEFIDAENLPAFLDGGKCTCGGKQCLLEANVGPWNPQGKQMFQENIHPIQQKKEEKVQMVCKIQNQQMKIKSQLKQPHNQLVNQVKTQQVCDQTQTQQIVQKQQNTEITQGTQTQLQKQQQAKNKQQQLNQTIQEGTETQEIPNNQGNQNTQIVSNHEKISQKEQLKPQLHQSSPSVQPVIGQSSSP